MFQLRTYLFCALILCSTNLLAGKQGLPEWEAGISTVVSKNGNKPFWLVSNRQGRYMPAGNATAIDLSFHSVKKGDRVFDYEYGVEAFGRLDSENSLWVHQLYGGLTFYGLINIKAGRWEEIIASKEPGISTGSVIWSGNARPVPKVQIGTPGYVEVPYTRGLVEIKGLISHGWLDDNRFASDVWLHHKNAFVRIGGSFPVNVYYGLNHYAQWGGSSPRHEEPYPAGLDAFLRIFFIESANPDHPGSPQTWINHKLGNHIGSRSHGVDIETGGYTAGVFLQDIMEDGSGWRRQNFPDGLWGIWLRSKEGGRFVQAVTYEYLQTTNQSGPYHDIDGEIVGGNDNYFNHAIYQSGWSYHMHTIGTPFISSPVYNDPEFHRFVNNRVRAHHIGFKGHIIPGVTYRNLMSYSRNYGTHNEPFENKKDQISMMLEVATQVGLLGLNVALAMSVDYGDMYGNNLGVMLRLSRKGIFD